MLQDFSVTMDDGSTYDISSDARDIRAWETQYERSWLAERLSFTNLTQLAFIAGQRTGVLNGRWADYASFDAHCVDARGKSSPVVASPTQSGATEDSSAPSHTVSVASRRPSKARDPKSSRR